EDVGPAGRAPGQAVEPRQLLEWVDAHVRVRADAQRDASVEDALDREEAVAEVRLRGEACADAPTRCREQVELVSVGMRRVDDRRAWAEAAARVEQLDRAHPVLREELLD